MDTADDSAPDGILGPHREKEGSFYTIKELWSPVVIHRKWIPPKFDGRIAVENRYIYTNLNQCQFKWRLVSFPAAGDTGIKPLQERNMIYQNSIWLRVKRAFCN